LRTIGARTYRALEEAITLAYQQVSSQDLFNWFTHCCYCTSSI
ncbi:MAG TPA: IS630 family transposase, partial [Stenomitos sp.]